MEGFLQSYGVTRLNVRDGYGIAEMNSVSEAARTIQLLNGHDFNGQPLAVRFKSQSAQQKQLNNFRVMANHLPHQTVPQQKDPLKQMMPVTSPDPGQQHMGQTIVSPQVQPNVAANGFQADLRVLQNGIQGWQLGPAGSNLNHPQHKQQMEQDLKNVAFLPEREKVRQLEQLVHLQQDKINKLEAKVRFLDR